MQRVDPLLSRLEWAGVAARARDAAALEDVASWLSRLGAAELVRVDALARRGWAPVLGAADGWRHVVTRSAPTATVVLAALHSDGWVREQAVLELVHRHEPVADRALALRATDHVPQVREPARREVLCRTAVDELVQLVPVLLQMGDRTHGASVGQTFLEQVEHRHGAASVWALLRDADEVAMRRAAFRHSAEHHLLEVDEASRLVAREPDAVVRSILVRLVADRGGPDHVRSLLASRSPEGRVLALVRLRADQIGAHDLRRLLVDRSELVRLWARRRRVEAGGDPVAECVAVARSGAAASVRASAYLGLVEAGGELPHDEVLALVGSEVPALVRVGLQLLVGHVRLEDVGPLLHVVATSTGRAPRLAEDALADALGLWGATDLEPLWSSPSPVVRHRAWRLQRRRGGWETTLADLRARQDLDREVSGAATSVAPPPYGAPTDDQRAQVRDLLLVARLDRRTELLLAITAGLPHVPAERPRGLQRALLDLDAGRPRSARERLKSLLATSADDLEVRRLLAEAYRRDGQPTEAGRWGLLEGAAASDAECEAFVRHVRYRAGERVGRTRMRHLLRTDHPEALADDVGLARLAAAARGRSGALSRLWRRVTSQRTKAGGSRVS